MTRHARIHVLLLCAGLFVANEAAALCVRAPSANLRAGPGTHFRLTWTVLKYMPLERIGRKGSWYRVRDVDGDTHWIHRSLVTGAIRCAVVKSRKANVRTGPSSRHRKLAFSPVDKYYSARVIGTEGKWVKVEDFESDEGWVARPLLWMPR